MTDEKSMLFCHSITLPDIIYLTLFRLFSDVSKDTTINVKNTGTREGQEVVQLYISDKKSSLPRPVKELKGFQKVKLAPGEEKAVTLTIDKKALSFFDDAKHEWVAEPGKFEAIIGSSSRDIKGTVPFELK